MQRAFVLIFFAIAAFGISTPQYGFAATSLAGKAVDTVDIFSKATDWLGGHACIPLLSQCQNGTCIWTVIAGVGVCKKSDTGEPAPVTPPFQGVNECETSADCKIAKINNRVECVRNPNTLFKTCVTQNTFVASGTSHECDGMFMNENACTGTIQNYSSKPGTICANWYPTAPNEYISKCVYKNGLPPQPVLCKYNSDCTSEKPVCIVNPKSGLRECVAADVMIGNYDSGVYGCEDYQKNSGVCNGTKGNTNATPDIKDSLCTKYWKDTNGWTPQCIHMDKLIELTAEGGALASAAPEQKTCSKDMDCAVYQICTSVPGSLNAWNSSAKMVCVAKNAIKDLDTACEAIPADIRYNKTCVVNPADKTKLKGPDYDIQLTTYKAKQTAISCNQVDPQSCSSAGADYACVTHFNGYFSRCVNTKLAFAGFDEAQTAGGAKPDVAKETGERFAPRLQIDIPGVDFTEKIQGEETPRGGKIFSIPFLAQYITGVYRYSLGIGAMLAIFFIMVAGFRWMTAAGNTATITSARTQIANATLGLLLLFGAYTILYQLNPDLLTLKFLSITSPKQEIFEVESLATEILNNETVAGDTAQATTPPGEKPVEAVADSPSLHKSSAQPTGTKLSDADIKNVAIKEGIDECLVWAFMRKEAGAKLLIGHDENYNHPNKPVSARKDLLVSGVKKSGAIFSPPATAANYTREMNATKIFNDDSWDPTKPPDYGLDWRFSHGIGFMQLTIFPKKNNAMGSKITGPNGPEWARKIKGRWYTVSDLMNVDSGIMAATSWIKTCAQKTRVLDAFRCTRVSTAAMRRALDFYAKCPLSKKMTLDQSDYAGLPEGSH